MTPSDKAPNTSADRIVWIDCEMTGLDLVTDALKAAAAARGSLAGAIFHSDHGSVYTSKDYATLCKNLGVTQSMGGPDPGSWTRRIPHP